MKVGTDVESFQPLPLAGCVGFGRGNTSDQRILELDEGNAGPPPFSWLKKTWFPANRIMYVGTRKQLTNFDSDTAGVGAKPRWLMTYDT